MDAIEFSFIFQPPGFEGKPVMADQFSFNYKIFNVEGKLPGCQHVWVVGCRDTLREKEQGFSQSAQSAQRKDMFFFKIYPCGLCELCEIFNIGDAADKRQG